jgi:hypothetical protein
MNLIHLTKLLTRAYREDEGDAMPTAPVSINPAAIRNFYPRNDGKPGTRLTFTDGGGYVVTESYADVKRYLETGEAPVQREPIALVTDASLN